MSSAPSENDQVNLEELSCKIITGQMIQNISVKIDEMNRQLRNIGHDCGKEEDLGEVN